MKTKKRHTRYQTLAPTFVCLSMIFLIVDQVASVSARIWTALGFAVACLAVINYLYISLYDQIPAESSTLPEKPSDA